MYKNYVNDLKKDGIKNLVIIPLIITVAIYLAPTILQLLISLVLKEPVDKVGSLSGAIGMIITVIMALFVMKKTSNISLSDLGIIKRSFILQFLKGAIGGFLFLSLVVLIIYLTGSIRIILNTNKVSIIALLIGLIFFIFQGTWEELMYRAYLMPNFSKATNDVFSIIITSILFTLGHALNPNMQFLPVINLFIASIVFSVIYYYTGSLIVVGAAHGLWNFSQGFIFGAEVSGNRIADSIFHSIPIMGKNLISGGKFGFEGGIITSIVGIILIIFFMIIINKKRKG